MGNNCGARKLIRIPHANKKKKKNTCMWLQWHEHCLACRYFFSFSLSFYLLCSVRLYLLSPVGSFFHFLFLLGLIKLGTQLRIFKEWRTSMGKEWEIVWRVNKATVLWWFHLASLNSSQHGLPLGAMIWRSTFLM